MRSYLVYGLIDPRSKELRYVGLTMTGLQFRMYQHLRDARVGVQRRCARWLKGLLAAGLAPEVEVLEVCKSAGTMVEAEQHHIAYFRSIGCNLTNLTDGGDGTFGYRHTSAAKAAQANAKWGNKNAVGHGRPSKPFVDNMGRRYERLADTGMDTGNVSKVLRGKARTAGGLSFKYVEAACQP